MIEWFKHDIHCLQDDRLFALVSRYGVDGYAVYFHTIEAMYANGGEPLSEISIRRIAFDFGLPLDKVQDILDYASSESCDYLLDCNDSGYTSERVIEECGKHSEKVEQMRRMGRASARRRADSKSNDTLNDTLNDTSTKRSTDKIRQDKKREDKNIPTSLTTFDKLVGGQQVDAPMTDEAKTDLFGEKIEVEEESVPYTTIADYWNKTLGGKLPKIKSITDNRRILIKQRWHEYHNDIYGIIDKVASSDFLTGWKACGFDWCFKKDNMVKIAEGNYENGKETAAKHRDYSDIKDEDLNGKWDWNV